MLSKDDTAVVFGEDVAFGGVFRCTMVSSTEIIVLYITSHTGVGARGSLKSSHASEFSTLRSASRASPASGLASRQWATPLLQKSNSQVCTAPYVASNLRSPYSPMHPDYIFPAFDQVRPPAMTIYRRGNCSRASSRS